MSTEAQTPAENSAPAAPQPQAPASPPAAQTPAQAQPQAPKDDDPNIVGHLTDEEMGQWQQNQRASQGLVNEIGNLVVKVVRGVGQINQLEASTEGMLKAAVGRLGLAEDTRFQVMRDGRIRVIAVPQPATPAAPPAPASGEINDEGKEEEPKGAAAVARAKAAAAAAAAKEAAMAKTEEPPAPTASPPADPPPAEAPAS